MNKHKVSVTKDLAKSDCGGIQYFLADKQYHLRYVITVLALRDEIVIITRGKTHDTQLVVKSSRKATYVINGLIRALAYRSDRILTHPMSRESYNRYVCDYLKRFNVDCAIQAIAEGAISPRQNKVMRVHFSESSYYEVSQSKVIAGMYDVLYVSTRSPLVKWLYRYTYEGITDWLCRYGYIGDNFELADAIERGDIYRP